LLNDHSNLIAANGREASSWLAGLEPQ